MQSHQLLPNFLQRKPHTHIVFRPAFHYKSSPEAKRLRFTSGCGLSVAIGADVVAAAVREISGVAEYFLTL